MNIVKFESQTSRIDQMRACVREAVSLAMDAMNSASIGNMMRSPLQDFQKEEEKLAA